MKTLKITFFSLLGILCISFFIPKISDKEKQEIQQEEITCNHNHSSPHTCSISMDPDPTIVTQPDGLELTVIAAGSRTLYYTETLSGYTVLMDTDGFYKYAKAVSGGELIPSPMIAHDQPTFFENWYLSNMVEPHLRYTGDAIANHTIDLSEESGNPNSKLGRSTANIYTKFPSTGARKVLAILIDYPNLQSTYTTANFESFFNDYNYNGTGSFRDYFLDNSFGQLDLDVDVHGWYRSSEDYEYYGDENGSARAKELCLEALSEVAGDGVDFSIYDNDGDGVVDGLIFVHAGPGAEAGNSDYIWSHKSNLNSNIEYDGVNVEFSSYCINPEIKSFSMSPIGVYCHEFGHILGLPDLYDKSTTSEGGDLSAGIGKWCVMSSGTRNNGGRTPAGLSAWCKEELGWINPIVIDDIDSYEVFPSTNYISEEFPVCYRINTPVSNEYFLLESRQNDDWDEFLPGHGLAIWHIDENRYSNINEEHKKVDLEEADGLNEMDLNINKGDAGDLYPGGYNNTAFDNDSNPNSQTYTTLNTNVCVTNIDEHSSGSITFDLSCVFLSCNVNAYFTYSTTNDPIVTFNSQSTDAETYSWDFDDGEYSTTEDPFHIYDENGTYTVTLTVTNSECGVDTYEEDIVIDNVIPEECQVNASFTPDYSNEPTISFISTSTNADTYSWDFNDGTTSIQENPIHTYTENGQYLVYLTAINEDCQTEDVFSKYIYINNIIPEEECSVEANFIYDHSNDPEVTFTSTSTDADTYLWDFGDGTTSTQENPTHTYTANESYTVELTVTNDDCGENGDDSYSAVVNIDDIIDDSCPETETYYPTEDMPEETHTSDWIKLKGHTIDASETVTLKAGSFIELLPREFDDNYPATIIEYGANFEAYIAPCEAGSGKKEITREETMATSLKVYPNPFSDIFNIEYTVNKEMPVTITIYNLSGQLETVVKDQEVHPIGSHNIEVDAQSLREGVYIVQILMEDQQLTHKLVKMR